MMPPTVSAIHIFCTRACLRVFVQEPDLFMAGEVKLSFEDDE